MKIECVALLALGLAGSCAAQLIQLGSNDPHYCADIEHIKPNLHVPSSVDLTGHVEDESGAPFKNNRIELRRFVSEARQVRTANAKTDDNGDFQLGQISKGDYRLLAS